MTVSLAAAILRLQLVQQIFVPVQFECKPPPGFVKFPEYDASYKIHEERVPWTEARDRCVAEGAHLAVFTSAKQIERIVNTTILHSRKFMHNGIHRSATTGEWVRVDNGLLATSIQWQFWYPWGGHNCTAMSDSNWFGIGVASYDCDEGLAFVCKRPIPKGCLRPVGPQGTGSPSLAGSKREKGEPGERDENGSGEEGSTGDAGAPDRFECEPPPGYVKFPEYNASYKIHEDRVPWDYARDRCIAEGAHLAVFTSVDKIRDIVDSRNPMILVNASADYLNLIFTHIGIYRPEATGDWIRVDNGLPATAIQWPARSYSDTDDNCAIMIKFVDLRITNSDCNLNLPFICEKPTAEGCPSPVGPPGTGSPCLAGSECEIGEPRERFYWQDELIRNHPQNKGEEGPTGNATALSQPGATGPTDPVDGIVLTDGAKL